MHNVLRFRHITVASKTLIADEFWRITFHGSDLAGFNSAGFDDHIKVFFPQDSGATLQLPQMTDEGIVWPDGVCPPARDYTPLAFDGESSLTLNFYIHDGGVASGWAQQAKEGDRLLMGGPRGSLVVPTFSSTSVMKPACPRLNAARRQPRRRSCTCLRMWMRPRGAVTCQS